MVLMKRGGGEGDRIEQWCVRCAEVFSGGQGGAVVNSG